MSDWEGWAAMVCGLWSLGSPILHKTIWRGCWHFYPSVTQNSYSRDPSRPPMAISTMQHHFVMSIMSDWEGWAAMVWVLWSLGSPILHKTIGRGCWHFYPSVTQNSYSRDPSRPPMAISTMQHHFVMSIMSDWEGWAAMVWVLWSLGSPILHKTIGRGCWHFYPSVTQNSYSRDPSRPPMAISTMQHRSLYPSWVIGRVELQWFGCNRPFSIVCLFLCVGKTWCSEIILEC